MSLGRPVPRPATDEPAAHGPLVIGATGGSGTRVVARIVRGAGVYIGRGLNESEDQLEIADYYDRWINPWLADSSSCEVMMRAELDEILRRHLLPRPRAGPWGWKEPRSIYLLPFLDRTFPSLRFLHVVRDGRYMAFSTNQNQLRKHGAAVLGSEGEVEPRRSIALWARANEAAADHGERRLGDRYLRLRFEDLLERRQEAFQRLGAFLGADPAKLDCETELERPVATGGGRSPDPRVIAELEARAGAALARFGYL